MILFFLEEDAVDLDGKLNRPKQKGCKQNQPRSLHLFRGVTRENDCLKSVVRYLKSHHDPIALQSMLITKQRQIGAEKVF